MRVWLTILLLFVYGCADNRAVQTAPPTPAIPVAPHPALTGDDVTGIVRTEVQQSSNAIQQNTQSLVSASVGKIAEKVDAALVRVESNVNAKLEASVNAHVELKDLRAELRASLDVQNRVTAQAEAIASLNAKLDALAAAQGQFVAGFNNTLSQTVQKLEAGRDVNNTQFTTEMAAVMERAYKSVTSVVYIMAGALVSILTGASVIINRSKENSRKRADERNEKTHALLEKAILHE